MDYTVTAIDRYAETFHTGEAYTFPVSAASKDEVMETIYTDHPSVRVAWIGSGPVTPVRVSQSIEMDEMDGIAWMIAEVADYQLDLYEERLEASKLPETVEDGTVDFLGWTYHIEGGHIIRRTCDATVKWPYLPYGGSYSSDSPLYTEWRQSKVSGKGKQWRWM